MSLLSRFTYCLEVKLNIYLEAFEFERRIEDPDMQLNALLEVSSAKMKTRNRTVFLRSVYSNFDQFLVFALNLKLFRLVSSFF